MERWVKITHITLLIINAVVWLYATYDILWDTQVMQISLSWYSTWLYMAAGIGIAGYLEALGKGESQWLIKLSFMCYVCYFF